MEVGGGDAKEKGTYTSKVARSGLAVSGELIILRRVLAFHCLVSW